MNWINKNIGKLIFTIILTAVFFGFYLSGSNEAKVFALIFLYFGVLIFIGTLPDWRWLKPILILIQIPAAIIMLLGPFVQTFLMVMVLSLFSFGVLGIILKYFPEYPFNFDLNFASKFFIMLITGSVLLTLCGNKAIQYFNSIFNSSRTEEREKSQLNFTISLINKEKIIFILYLIYFLYLLPYSVALLSNTHLFEIENLDKAIFNAFITYTAFERLLANKDRIKMNFKGFSSKLLDAWK